MLYHENLTGVTETGKRDWISLTMKATNPKPLFRSGMFPTFASFINYMQRQNVGIKINPFTVRSVIEYNAVWQYITLSFGSMPEEFIDLTLVGKDDELVKIVKMMETKSGVVAPIGFDLMHKFDSIFLCWFVEAFFAASRKEILNDPTAFGEELDPKIMGRKAFGSTFTNFFDVDPVFNRRFIELWLKNTNDLTGHNLNDGNAVQHFAEHDYSALFSGTSRVRSLKANYAKNMQRLLGENVDFALIFDTPEKFESIIDVDFLEYLREMNPNFPESQKRSEQVNIVVEENYLKPRDKSGSAFAEKLKRQREAQAKSRELSLVVRCPRPEKKIHRTDRKSVV